ncbi:reverse transcriptase [Mycena venus]|uniref:Reverse transcriptase n=1 Tax=Mycena venus TaxID=2733690 RepID=A0A8H6Z9F7_9AGAR|nr:reverse transcriptase [Mycena venus]
MAKRWWKPLLTSLRTTMRRLRRSYQRIRTEKIRTERLDARRAFYRAISQAKFEVWMTFVKELERIDVYKALKRMKGRSRGTSLSPTLIVAAFSAAPGSEKWPRNSLLLTLSTNDPSSPNVTPETRVDQTGSGDRGMREGGPPGGFASQRTSALGEQARFHACLLNDTDPIALAETIAIEVERPFIPPTDSEIDRVIMSSSPWKAPDRYGIQMEHVQRGYPVLCGWIRAICRASLTLGAKPSPFKANVATPAIDDYIHRVKEQLDKGNTVSTLFYDLKGAFNRISHRVVVQEMAALGFPRMLIRWVASFLHFHLVTVVIYGAISTASKSPSQNVLVLNKATAIAAEWAKADGATFEHLESELLHHSQGRADLSSYCVTFDGITIHPSDLVKWIGVLLDSKLTGDAHIKSRAASAARALNTALALTHAVWGLKPFMIRDLANTVVLPRADYGVNSFFPLATVALIPLERVNNAGEGSIDMYSLLRTISASRPSILTGLRLSITSNSFPWSAGCQSSHLEEHVSAVGKMASPTMLRRVCAQTPGVAASVEVEGGAVPELNAIKLCR